MTNNKEFREKFNTIMNREGSSSRKILEVLSLADEYEIDEFDLDEEFEYYEASKKVTSGECSTLNEAVEIINDERQTSLNRIVESVESRKSSNWLFEANSLTIRDNSNKDVVSSDEDNSKSAEDIEFDKFDEYCDKAHIDNRDKLHFYSHVCFPWVKYEPTNLYISKSNKHYKEIARNQLPPFGDNLIKSFENYTYYNHSFIVFKNSHSLDTKSKELEYFNSNLTRNDSVIESMINYYKSICYIGARSGEKSKCAVKIKRNTLLYQGKSLDLLCYIVYNIDTKFVISSGIVSFNLSNRTYLAASTSMNLPESEYSVEYSLNFDVEYYVCHIHRGYKFVYEAKVDKLSEVLNKYNTQTLTSRDIIYAIFNDVVGRLYYLQQTPTGLFAQLNNKYRHINLGVNHTPIKTKTTKEALKELDDIDD